MLLWMDDDVDLDDDDTNDERHVVVPPSTIQQEKVAFVDCVDEVPNTAHYKHLYYS